MKAMVNRFMVIFASVILISLFTQPYVSASASQEKEKMINVEITQYDENGIAEKKTIKLPYHIVEMLKEKLIKANDNERTKLLREYGLLPEHEMKYPVRDGNNINTTVYGKLGLINVPVLFSTFSRVNAIYVLNGGIHLGIPITGTRKFFGSNVFSYDLIDMCWGAIGIVETQGLVRTHTLITIPSVLLMGGFIGIHIHVPMLLDIYHGYSAMTFAVGLGFHSINFNPLLIYFGFALGLALGLLLYVGGGSGGGGGS